MSLHQACEETAQGLQKSPLLYFDFVEFYGRSGRVSACMLDLGHCTTFSPASHPIISAARGL